jgi:AraC family transcriptional regulator of arabinose operon
VPERGELDAILSITGNENIEAQNKANALMLSVMMRCITENGCTLGGVEHYSPMVSDALRFIRGALRADLDIDTVAEQLFASRHTLQKKFKAELGISIGKYIDELLMIEAERMLCTEGMSIEAISEQLGFCDRFYFTRRFAQKYGYSPLRYLKAQRNSAY